MKRQGFTTSSCGRQAATRAETVNVGNTYWVPMANRLVVEEMERGAALKFVVAKEGR